jgi:hypothetical protein
MDFIQGDAGNKLTQAFAMMDMMSGSGIFNKFN